MIKINLLKKGFLMQKPEGWDGVKPREFGGPRPKAGGNVMKIVNVEEGVSKTSGSPMIILSLDIAMGPLMNYYKKQSEQFKWDQTLKIYFPITGEGNLERLKAAVQAIEESNTKTNYRFDWDNIPGLLGKWTGACLQEERYISQRDKQEKRRLIVYYLCPARRVTDGLVEVPPVLNSTVARQPGEDNDAGPGWNDDAPPHTDDDLPF